MAGNLNYYTYKGRQARGLIAALQVLLDQNLLSAEEKGVAKVLQSRLRGAAMKEDEEYTMVAFSDKQNELLQHVEQSLWRLT